mmetsp:Transcript_66981/g.111259  ORF Transcript_66981/g.111259 Transcript_66981/m.111259 type:complete len:205 (-) Transcript_66981:1024-1638(-)
MRHSLLKVQAPAYKAVPIPPSKEKRPLRLQPPPTEPRPLSLLQVEARQRHCRLFECLRARCSPCSPIWSTRQLVEPWSSRPHAGHLETDIHYARKFPPCTQRLRLETKLHLMQCPRQSVPPGLADVKFVAVVTDVLLPILVPKRPLYGGPAVLLYLAASLLCSACSVAEAAAQAKEALVVAEAKDPAEVEGGAPVVAILGWVVA